MQSIRSAALLLLLLATQILTNCSSPANNGNAANGPAAPNSSSTSKVVPKDNVEEFGILVRLPFEPEEVAWEENPTEKSLTAVIRFSPENTAKMSAELAKLGAGTPETLSVETWYPAELIAQGRVVGPVRDPGPILPGRNVSQPAVHERKDRTDREHRLLHSSDLGLA